jgi:cell division protein FtsL
VKNERFLMSKQVRNEQLVRELDSKRHRELFMVALTALALTAAVIGFAYPHFEMIRLGYRMEELREQREKLIEDQRHLELQRATELAPARIEAIATEQLGMVYPAGANLLVVESFEMGHLSEPSEPNEHVGSVELGSAAEPPPDSE